MTFSARFASIRAAQQGVTPAADNQAILREIQAAPCDLVIPDEQKKLVAATRESIAAADALKKPQQITLPSATTPAKKEPSLAEQEEALKQKQDQEAMAAMETAFDSSGVIEPLVIDDRETFRANLKLLLKGKEFAS